MTLDPDKLEERTAAILGQIQASVAEYVRTMNEAGALRRREADEAHRQQDEALRNLKTIQIQAAAAVETHAKLSARVGNDWLALVERGLRETALAQAEVAARAATTQLDLQVRDLTSSVRDALSNVNQIADRNERICRSLAWKTVVTTAAWLLAVSIGFRIFTL